MDTNSLQAFVAVAETGSFSQAAVRLFLTQPAISKRIATLEGELGVALFERLGRRVLLTEAGAALLPRAKSILLEMAESRQLIADLGNHVGGVLCLAISHHIGLHRLPQILRQFGQRYPRVQLDLHFMDSEAGCQAVAQGELELAVVTLPPAAMPKLQLRPIWQDSLSVMVGAAHPLLAIAPLSGTDLGRYPAILPERGTVTRLLIDRAMAELAVPVQIGVETNYLETIRMLVAAGLGWSVLPLSMVNADTRAVSLDGLRIARTLGLVIRERAVLSSAATAFIELLP